MVEFALDVFGLLAEQITTKRDHVNPMRVIALLLDKTL